MDVDADETERLVEQWEERGHRHPAEGRRLAVPGGDRTRSSTTSRNIRSESPRDVVTVYIPEYVVGHWWEQILHNQSALRLKGRLLFTPGVMVTSVPYQLPPPARPRNGSNARRPTRTPADARSVTADRRRAHRPGRGRAGRARRALRRPAWTAG